MEKLKIGFVGAGNMARALIGGLVGSGVTASNIYSFDPNPDRVQNLCRDYGISAAESNQAMLETCGVIVLAVKPQTMRVVIESLKLPPTPPLFLSIAAGLRSSALCKWFGRELALVRAMPNTPALVRAGATALYANPAVSEKQRENAEFIMRAVGITLWLEEEAQMDAVTAVSGSGPAYFFYLMEAMEQAATQLGLTAEAAHLLTVQTGFGAAKLALEVEEAPGTLRERVTSPGGTTERAIAQLDQQRARDTLIAAISAAQERSQQLAQELEQST